MTTHFTSADTRDENSIKNDALRDILHAFPEHDDADGYAQLAYLLHPHGFRPSCYGNDANPSLRWQPYPDAETEVRIWFEEKEFKRREFHERIMVTWCGTFDERQASILQWDQEPWQVTLLLRIIDEAQRQAVNGLPDLEIRVSPMRILWDSNEHVLADSREQTHYFDVELVCAHEWKEGQGEAIEEHTDLKEDEADAILDRLEERYPDAGLDDLRRFRS